MLRALALTVLWAVPALAQSDRVALEWQRWREARGNPDGALVFMIGGQELLALDSGATADAPLPLASNSKAITALCAAALVAEGLITWEDPVGTWIEGGGPARLADLVTHTAGLWPDETQRGMVAWRGDPAPRWHEVADTALRRPVRQGARGAYRYNNENYAVLARVIEQASGRGYEEVCRARVLDPLGIASARLSAEFGGYGPWGGWEMSVRDYARLMASVYAKADPLEAPHADLGGGLSYGLGMLFRTGRSGASHWHFGALCFADGGIGAYAVTWAGRYTLAAAYAACVDDAGMLALDQALARAVFAD